jgi:hypothetical protein
MQYYIVFGTFLVMHVMVVLGIYAKISQENMSGLAVALIILILSTQVAQNFVFLVIQTVMTTQYFTASQEKKPYESMLFNIGLLWHIIVTGIVFSLAMEANRTAS